MINRGIGGIFLLSLFGLMLACQSSQSLSVERGFYYWKNTSWRIEPGELSAMGRLSAQRLYVKFFEVAPDPVFTAVPTAKTSLRFSKSTYSYYGKKDSFIQKAVDSIQVIPTVFIQNEVFKRISSEGMDSLADNLLYLVKKYSNERFKLTEKNIHEIQIDCDWTASTKENYFAFLEKLKGLTFWKISCTLRLYPYKYPDKMGVPPVDRVMLMCYNLISPLKNKNKNSILDNEELVAYLRGVEKYPKPIDIALPIFSWMHWYQHDQLAGVIRKPSENFLENLEAEENRALWYTVKHDMTEGDYYLREGDKVKYENIAPSQLEEATRLLKQHIQFSQERVTVVFFALDEYYINKITNEALEDIYRDFTE